MKFSIAKQDITPTFPVFQAGFGSRTCKSEGVLQPIYIKAVLLQANKTVLIVAFDAMGADRSFVDGIKDALRERFGLAHDEVLLNFSHAHSSIYLTGLDATKRQGVWSIGQDHCPADSGEGFAADEEYFRYLRASLLDLVESCCQNLSEGQLSIASAQTDFSISRRLPLGGGKTTFAPNPAAEIDRDLFVLKLTDESGAIKGIIYSHGSHPTTLSDTYVIANDFISFTALELESAYPKAISVFLQACGAELKPLATVGASGGFSACDIPAVERIGQALAGEVSAILRDAKFDHIDCHFKTALEDCTLPAAPEKIEFYRNILKVDIPGGFEHTGATRALAARLDGTAKEFMPCYVAVWQLDARTHLVAIESEVSTEYSLAIKNYFSRGNMVVLGYSNGVTCYIPSRKMIGKGGYEAECNYFFGLQGPFAPEIEDILIGRVARLLNTVQ